MEVRGGVEGIKAAASGGVGMKRGGGVGGVAAKVGCLLVLVVGLVGRMMTVSIARKVSRER